MEAAIEANVKRGVWIPVNHAGPWASANVPVLKRNCTLRLELITKALRTVLYRQIHTNHQHNQVLSELASGCIYGTIGSEKAYTQIPVDGETSHMLTVNTVQGLHSVTRLPFGIKITATAF
ncbi:hypothetical protein PR048_023587 [Dryococelus australis]|uniref:Uncharacterized protein n=1 Tax=Dryococelus australis TaxID=614101 RepID=A0ABQ9GUJ9_9NEOP|nr:hypothetical protein PR048_023587 [Dryococelus australis]